MHCYCTQKELSVLDLSALHTCCLFCCLFHGFVSHDRLALCMCIQRVALGSVYPNRILSVYSVVFLKSSPDCLRVLLQNNANWVESSYVGLQLYFWSFS